jgi:hypothetical protein
MATTQNTYTGNGSTTNYSFTFEYLKQSDVKVTLDTVATTAFTFANATTLSFTSAPANNVAIRIFRDTAIDTLSSTFFPGSTIKAEDLNQNFTQNLYVTQESETAVDISDTTANDAKTTAEGAVTTANSAVTTANSAVTTANSAVTTANSAVNTANAASVAVSNAVLFTLVATVAAIPESPFNNDIIEIGNSTGIESFSPLSGLPSGFVGASGLTVRLRYDSSASTWVFMSYFANDSEDRYLTKNIPLGSATAPSLAFTGDTNTGIYSPGADQVAITTGGTERLRIASTGAMGLSGANYGTAGQVFVSNGSSASPTWEEVGAPNTTYTYPGGVEQTIQARLEQYVNVKDFGAVGDGVTDDTAAIQAALDTLPALVSVPAGDYKISASINIKENTSLVGAGKDTTKFIVDPFATAYNTNTNAWVSKAGPAPSAIPSLAQDYGKSAWIITFSGNHGLKAGDLILFMGTVDGGFNGFRAYYFKGEYNTVQEVVSPTQIYLTHATLDSYDAADTEMYKCSYVGGSLSDFSVIGNGYSNSTELALKNTQGCSVESVYVTGSSNACMSVIQSYNTDIRKTTCFQNEPAGGTSYGLFIANSQLTRIQGRFKAARHAVAHGGAIEFGIPCRYSVTYNSFLETDMLGNAPAFDCHGNSEYITLTDSFLTGGISIGGNHSLISGCQITSGQVQTSSMCQYAELHGLDHILTDCYIYSGFNNTNFGVIDFGGNSQVFNANTYEGGTINISNCVLDFPAHEGFGIEVRNRGSLTDYNIVVDNVDMRMPNQAAGLAGVYVATFSGNTPRSIQVTRVTPGPINKKPLYIGVNEISNNTPIRQDSVSGIETITVDTGDTTEITAPIDLPFIYARQPSMVMSGELLYDEAGGAITPWVAQNQVGYPSSSEYRIRLMSTGGAAVNTFDAQIHWTASLQDF